MEAVAHGHGGSRGSLALAARILTQLSIVAAVATGCWLFSPAPAVAIGTATLFLVSLLFARWRLLPAHAAVLLFTYIATGLVLRFLPAFPSGSLWLAALAGLVVGGCSWRHWSAPAGWRWPLMLWLLGVALSWPIIAAREADFSGVLSGSGVGLVVSAALLTLCTGLWLESALTWDRHTIERFVAAPLLVSVLVSCAAVFYQAFVDITWLSSDIWIHLRRAPGLMGDANPMAVAAALWAPLAPLVVARRRPVARVGLVLTPVLWAAAWFTGARTAIVLIGAGAIGLAAGAVVERSSVRRARWFIVAALGAAVVIVVVLSRSAIGGPIARLTATLPLDRPLDLAYEVLWRRDGYGLAAVRAVREHPWSGVGHGAFYTVSSYFYRLNGGAIVPPDNAQSLWRQALAERGLLAFPAVIGFTVAAARLLLRSSQDVTTDYVWTLKAVVVGLGVVMMFGYPVQNPAIAITAAAALAWLNAAVASPPFRQSSSLPRAILVVVWLLAVTGALVDLRHARGDLRPPWRAARVGDPYVRGFAAIESGPRGASGRVVSDYAVVALRPTGTRYILRLWVRGADARHVRAWQNQRLIMDELLPAGVLIERVLETPPDRGVLLEFDSDEPGLVVTGDFVN